MTTIMASVPAVFAEESKSLDTVVVTGRRTESRLAETPQQIEIIDKKDIERTPSQDLTDILKKNSSVDVIDWNGHLSGVGIRGYRPEYSGFNQHTLTLIDGRPAMSDNLTLFNTSNIERIEVLKGPASALYGSSAMGGVVNIITHEGRGKIEGFGKIAYGTEDTKELRGAIGGALNPSFDFDYSGSYVDRRADYRMGNGVTRLNTSYTDMGHALRLGVNINEDWRANLKGDVFFARDVATPGNVYDGTTGQGSKDMDRWGSELSLKGRISDHNLLARVFKGDQSYTLYTKTSKLSADQKYLPFRYVYSHLTWQGWQIQDNWAWSDTSSFVFGVDVQNAKKITRYWANDGTEIAPGAANNEQKTLGLYGENTWYFNDNNSTFYIGARRDTITLSTLATPFRKDIPASADFTSTNPSSGFKHLLGGGFRLHGTVGKGFTTPDPSFMTANAASTSGGITTISTGNPGLKPESSVTADLGLEWSNSTFFGDLTLFTTKVKDKVVNIKTRPNATTVLSTWSNANEAKMRGLEWTSRWKANRHTQFSVSGTHFFSRQEQSGSTWTDIRNVPRNTVRAAADFEHGNWNARISLRHSGRYTSFPAIGDTSKLLRFDGFTLVDLSAAYRFDKRQSITVSMNNLLNRYYEETVGYGMPGINGRLAYRYDF